MKPASSAKRAKRAKAAAKSARERLLQSSKPKSKNQGGGQKSTGGGQNFADQNESSQDTSGLIRHGKPTMGRQEQQAAAQIVKSGFAGGKEITLFEEEFCRYIGVDSGHAIALTSPETALFIVLTLFKSTGRDIALPAYGPLSLQKTCKFAGANTRLIDSVEQGHVDLQALTAAATPLALISHTFGLPVEIKNIKEQTIIIEDCSESLGAKVGGKHTGTTGNAAIFSLAEDNIITGGGQVGMLVLPDKGLIDQAKAIVSTLNLGISDLQAAIARVQLAKIGNLMARREEIFNQYKDSGFDMIESAGDAVQPNYFRAILRTAQPQAVLDFLAKGMIETKIPVAHDTLGGTPGQYPIAEKLSRTTLSLPVYPHLSNAEVAEIIGEIEQALESVSL